MKFSICIPQYNRIQYLLKSLAIIEKQTYPDIEIVISDDASSDDTPQQIQQLQKVYRYPIIFSRNEKNMGYDRNYRKALEMATGQYCIVLGNDDSLYSHDTIASLVQFLQQHDYPDVGFCNFAEESNPDDIIKRAHVTGVIGSGPETALKYYSCFSFVAGIVYKKEIFDQFNSDKYDGSIYAQIALGCMMISKGCRLFSVMEPVVLKDLQFDNRTSNSYRDTLPRKWKEYKKADGGLKSVIRVLFIVFSDSGTYTKKLGRAVFKKIYRNTLPFWILDYKYNKAFPAAMGIFMGMKPWSVDQFSRLPFIDRVLVIGDYCIFSVTALLTPSRLFYRFKNRIYAFIKK